tara:strand:- start:3594 stop:3740 length:147 start_codon:yes stop_codon:yes gene_type:complete
MPFIIPLATAIIGVGAGFVGGRTATTAETIAKAAVVIGAGIYLYQKFK